MLGNLVVWLVLLLVTVVIGLFAIRALIRRRWISAPTPAPTARTRSGGSGFSSTMERC